MLVSRCCGFRAAINSSTRSLQSPESWFFSDSSKLCAAALPPGNRHLCHLRQFPISAFAENTRSAFFINRGNFFGLHRVPSLKAVPRYKTRLTGASKKEGTQYGRRIDWIGGRDFGDGSSPRRAVHLLPGSQAAQRRAARGDCPRS